MDRMRKFVLIGLIIFSVGTLESYNPCTFLWYCAARCTQRLVSFFASKKEKEIVPEFKVDVHQTIGSFEDQKYYLINKDHGCYGVVKSGKSASFVLKKEKFTDLKKDTATFYHTVFKTVPPPHTSTCLIDVGATSSHFVARRLPAQFEQELQSTFLVVKAYLLSFLHNRNAEHSSSNMVKQAFESACKKVWAQWHTHLKNLEQYRDAGSQSTTSSNTLIKDLPVSYALIKSYKDRLWCMQAGLGAIEVANAHHDLLYSSQDRIQGSAPEKTLLPHSIESIPLQHVHTITMQYPESSSCVPECKIFLSCIDSTKRAD